jgi:hypothetical protein
MCKGTLTKVTSKRKQFAIDIKLSDLIHDDYENKLYLNYYSRTNTNGANYTEVLVEECIIDITPFTDKYITVGEGNFNFTNYILEVLNHYTPQSALLRSHDELLNMQCTLEADTLHIVIDYYTPIVLDNVGGEHDEISFNTAYVYELDNQGVPTATKYEIDTTYNEYLVNASAGSVGHSPLEFITVDKISEVTYNTMSNANRFKKPISRIEQNVLKINNADYFYSNNVMLKYIKQPRKYDFITGQMCEIKDTEGILRIAVKLMESYLLNKDANSYQIKEKNSLIIN